MKAFALLAVLIFVGCSAAPVREAAREVPPASRWPMEGGGPGRAGQAATAVAPNLSAGRMATLVERPGYRPEEYATPIPVGPVAYVGHAGRAFQAVRWRTGEIVWSRPTRGRVFTTAAVAGEAIVFGDDQGDVVALSPAGRELWRFRTSYPVVSSPIADGGRVFIPSSDQNIYCLDAATGRALWQYEHKFPQKSSIWRGVGLALGEGRLYAGFSDGTLVALDPELGKLLWKAEFGRQGLFADVVAGPSVRGGRVFAGSLRGPVLCLEAASGKELWRQEQELAAGFAVGEELVYAGTAAGSVVALVVADGKKAWEVPLDGGVPTAPVLAGDSVLVGASQGSLHVLDARTGQVRQKYASGSGLHGQPAVFEEGVLFLSNAGVLHWLR